MHSFPLLADHPAGLGSCPALSITPASASAEAAISFLAHPLPMWLQEAQSGRIAAVNEATIRHYGLNAEQLPHLAYEDLLAREGPAPDGQVAMPCDGEVVCHRLARSRLGWMRLFVSPVAVLQVQGEGQGRGQTILVTAVDVTVHHREAELLRETVREVHRLQEMAWHERNTAEMAQTELRALSRGLIGLQERERRYIARELHDEIGQSLSAIRVQFAKLRRRVEGTELKDLIDAAGTMTEQTLGRVRNLSLMLHPPQLETLGLEAALRWHIGQVSRLHGLDIAFDVEPIEEALRPEVAIAAYRIVQEALSNVVRHARATHVAVALRREPTGIRLAVSDDGVGFLMSNVRLRWEEVPSLGLIGMQERARQLGGELSVQSQPGRGTRIEARLPWR